MSSANKNHDNVSACQGTVDAHKVLGPGFLTRNTVGMRVSEPG